jgi:hypothetical protein
VKSKGVPISRSRRRPRALIQRESFSHTNYTGRPKVAFVTETSASAAAERRQREIGLVTVTYRCNACGLFHLGSERGAAS